MTTTEPCPLFDLTAGPHAAHVEALLSTRPPTCRQIIAAVDAAAEEGSADGD